MITSCQVPTYDSKVDDSVVCGRGEEIDPTRVHPLVSRLDGVEEKPGLGARCVETAPPSQYLVRLVESSLPSGVVTGGKQRGGGLR